MLLKVRAGVPVAAYLDEGYLEESGLMERITVGGRTVGVLKNGVFQTVATDLRGTVLAETTGVPRLASPFGQRDVHTGLSEAIEYVEKGYDADLGLVRMGARDYDPETGRFTTPDPLFLETVEKCLEKPKQANLFGYAQGDPLGFGDPSGLEGFSLSRGLSAAASFVAGVAGGVAESVFGNAGPNNDVSSRDYQLGRAAGLFVSGIVQLQLAGAMLCMGGVGEVGGGAATLTGAGAVVGLPAMALSTAAIVASAGLVVSGAATLVHAKDVYMAASDAPSGSGSKPPRANDGPVLRRISRPDRRRRILGSRRSTRGRTGRGYSRMASDSLLEMLMDITGAWKMADSVKDLGKKETRSGTYDPNLKRIGDWHGWISCNKV